MSIQILPPRLANQIAAGEVVERPASVVKELIENSLDAGASRIDIEIEKGGIKLIRIKDNGGGVPQQELGLALSRHATSKVVSLDDLEAIVSLGFRGEALASISSVSRLTFTSKTQQQDQGWQALAEGRDMDVKQQPCAHPCGTTVEVMDLFFNTPARRRFLRSEKTEFAHIDELIKRIALSRFNIHLTLKHNGRMIRNYRPAGSIEQQEKRVASVCSSQFMHHAIAISAQHSDLKVWGWIVEPQGARSQNDVQYCYVNGRMMRDKLINHAIRQAYEDQLPAESYAAYVLFIELDPGQVDVNVHPAKHEVRFHQARLVHDFILQSISQGLAEIKSVGHEESLADSVREIAEPSAENSIREGATPWYEPKHNYRQSQPPGYRNPDSSSKAELETYAHLVGTELPSLAQQKQPEVSAESSLGRALSLVQGKYLLVESETIQLVSLVGVWQLVTQQQLIAAWSDGATPQPLLLPVSIKVGESLVDVAKCHENTLKKLGMELKSPQSGTIIVAKVPAQLRNCPLSQLIPQLLQQLASYPGELMGQQVIELCFWLALEASKETESFSWQQAVSLLTQLDKYLGEEVREIQHKLCRNVDLTNVINSFEQE